MGFTMQDKYISTTRYTLRNFTDRNGEEHSASCLRQYIEVQSVPGSIRCKGIYVIKTGDVKKIWCTFYFNVVAMWLKRAATCHQGEVDDAMQQDAGECEFVFMASDEEKPKLKPIKGKRSGNIIGFVMTFPDLHPKFFAKFKKELGKKNKKTRRKSLYSPRDVRKSLRASRPSSPRWN